MNHVFFLVSLVRSIIGLHIYVLTCYDISTVLALLANMVHVESVYVLDNR